MMKRLPFGKGNKSDKTERPKTNRISPSPFAQSDSKDRTTATTYLNLPDAAPALPPLQFGLEGATANTFDLGEMLVETENKNTPLSIASSIDLVAPRSTPMDSGFLRQSHNTVDTYRQGTTSIHSGHYHRLDTITELGSSTSIPKQLEQEKSNHAVNTIPASSCSNNEAEDNTKTRTNAEETIRDLRMELAKYNPMSPLLHGAPQQEYGLLIQRTNKLKRQYCEMEEALETMLIEKDLLAMDLKAMEDAIGSKEFDFVGLSDNGAKLPQRDPGFRCRKDAYQTDVRELRDQKAQLKDEIEGLKGQREEILNEMQILSTRNMDLSAMNDTLSNEQQMHRGSKRRQSYASSVMGNSGITNSFAEKIRRPRLQAQVPDSTTSSTWRLSTSDDQDDDASTRRTNWRKSTMKPVMGISAMIGKMMADIPSQTGTSSQTRAARGFPSQSSDGVSEGISSDHYTHLESPRSSNERHDVTASRMSSDPDAPPVVPTHHVMFGNDLHDQLNREQRTIPLVVAKCIEAVDLRGLEVEGIYRRSGMAAESRRLVEAFNHGCPPNLIDPEIYQDICSITSVLKQYLRSLPESLVPSTLYAELMDTIHFQGIQERLQAVDELVHKLPGAHFRTLSALMHHLGRVTENSTVNLMNAKNLSVVFGPTLMWSPDPRQEMADVTNKNMVIEFLIIHTRELFASVNNMPEGTEGASTPTEIEDEAMADTTQDDTSSMHTIVTASLPTTKK